MPTLKMTEDKILTITKAGNTYEDENNAEVIKVLLPRQINDNDLNDCVIHLCVLNQDNLGDEINISTNLKEYSDDLYVADINITNNITYKSGQIQLWIKILKLNNEMVAKTNAVTYQIKEHLNIEDYIPEQNLSLLDDFSIKMEILFNKADNGEFNGEKGDPGYTPQRGVDYWTEEDKAEIKAYAVKSERDLIDSSSIRLYGVKKNQDVFEAPRSNTSSSEANESVDRSATGYDRFLNEDVYIYQNTIMRRDDNGRCSILTPVYPKHITNKEYVDNTVQQAIQQAVLDSWEVGV